MKELDERARWKFLMEGDIIRQCPLREKTCWLTGNCGHSSMFEMRTTCAAVVKYERQFTLQRELHACHNHSI